MWLVAGISVVGACLLMVLEADGDPKPSKEHFAEPQDGRSPTLTGRDGEEQVRVPERPSARAKGEQRGRAQRPSPDPIKRIEEDDATLAQRIQRLLGIEPKAARDAWSRKLGEQLGETQWAATEILRLLQSTNDEQTIAMVYDLLRANAMKMATPAERRAFGSVLRHDPSPQVRRAAARALFMTEAFRAGVGDEVKAIAREMNALIVEAIHEESSPLVLETVASLFSNWYQPIEAFVALQDAGQRLAPGPQRRRIYQMAGRTLFLLDQGASQVRAFDEEADPALRDDIAAGIAAGGMTGSASSRGDRDALRLEVAANRRRILDLLAGTSDVAVRRLLLRASLRGLRCIVPTLLEDRHERALAARFVRDALAMEPDEAMRERLERFATLVEKRGAEAIPRFATIMRGIR